MPWRSTPEQREQARKWAGAGYTLGMISVRLGFSKTTIQRWIRPEIRKAMNEQSLAYRRENHARLNAHARRYMRGKRLGTCPVCDRPTPRKGIKQCRACRKEDRDWRRNELMVLWNDGLSAQEIAQRTGRTPRAITAEVQRMRKDGWNVPKRRNLRAAGADSCPVTHIGQARGSGLATTNEGAKPEPVPRALA
jgi:transposase